MARNDEKQLVDTLFGKREEAVPAAFDYAEELPHVLFGGDNQETLPLIRVPLYAPVVVEPPSLRALMPYVDELSLFEKRWGCAKKDGETRDEWCERMNKELVPVLNTVRSVCENENILRPRAVYVYVNAKADGDTVDFYQKDGQTVFASLTFERRADGRSVADAFPARKAVPVALMAVGVGKNADSVAKKWLLLGQDTEYGCLDGFVREVAAAMTLYAAEQINKAGGCVGNAVPLNAADGKTLSAFVRETQADRIEVGFSRTYGVVPQYSALALVLPD